MFTPPHVIPAKAGIQRPPACDLRGLYDDTGDLGSTCPSWRGRSLLEGHGSVLVRPGFEHKKEPGAWIPAFAGMTLSRDRLAPCYAEFIRQTWCST